MSTGNKTNASEKTAAVQPITDDEAAGVTGGLIVSCPVCQKNFLGPVELFRHSLATGHRI